MEIWQRQLLGVRIFSFSVFLGILSPLLLRDDNDWYLRRHREWPRYGKGAAGPLLPRGFSLWNGRDTGDFGQVVRGGLGSSCSLTVSIGEEQSSCSLLWGEFTDTAGVQPCPASSLL